MLMRMHKFISHMVHLQVQVYESKITTQAQPPTPKVFSNLSTTIRMNQKSNSANYDDTQVTSIAKEKPPQLSSALNKAWYLPGPSAKVGDDGEDMFQDRNRVLFLALLVQ